MRKMSIGIMVLMVGVFAMSCGGNYGVTYDPYATKADIAQLEKKVDSNYKDQVTLANNMGTALKNIRGEVAENKRISDAKFHEVVKHVATADNKADEAMQMARRAKSSVSTFQNALGKTNERIDGLSTTTTAVNVDLDPAAIGILTDARDSARKATEDVSTLTGTVTNLSASFEAHILKKKHTRKAQ